MSEIGDVDICYLAEVCREWLVTHDWHGCHGFETPGHPNLSGRDFPGYLHVEQYVARAASRLGLRYLPADSRGGVSGRVRGIKSSANENFYEFWFF